jgi:glutamate-1-semialdehyde 2,1-aminomutase
MVELTNEGLYQRGLRRIPGGVNSPVRAFRSVGGTPYFVARAEGAHVWDVEGTRFIDYVQSYGSSRRYGMPRAVAPRTARRRPVR